MWEEPCISGEKGSGTVFFSGCNMRCVYCQNHEISSGLKGIELDDGEVKNLFLKISKSDVHNINLVTPTHYLPRLIKILSDIRKEIRVPIVYNCSGYENVALLDECRGIIDVFLTDFKYKSGQISKKYSDCSDYFQVAMTTLEKMVEIAGKPIFDDGIMKKGVILRHLILPSHKNDSMEILRSLYKRFGNDKFLVSLMSQFTPNESCQLYPEINRSVTSLEYKRVREVYEELGFEGYIQERSSATEKYIPDFDEKGEFLLDNYTIL
ncbi:MAG: radical SAM protein [Clostridia bacterium]|nr:radical SAM protein [Clostridia bacterium]